MTSTLPLNVLVLVCELLEHQRDFCTLFRYALTCKFLAGVALRSLYRIYSDHRRYFNLDPLEKEFVYRMVATDICISTRESEYLSKLARLWKSIILSSINKTAYPYCLYIRHLDLENLYEFIGTPPFRCKRKHLHGFFTADLARFVAGTQLGQTNYMEVPRLKSVELSEVIGRIGDSIISYAHKAVKKSKTTSSLEYLSCRPDPRFALEDWIGKLPKLKTVSLRCLNSVNPDVSKAISRHCPELRNMGFFVFNNSCGIETAESLTLLSKGLKHNSLKKISISTPDDIEDELLLALKFHTRSLTHLSISVEHFIQTHNIDLLHNCKNLTSLCLLMCPGYYGPEDIADDEDEVVTEMIDWIGSYLGLRELSMDLPYGEIAILTQVMKRNSIRLQRLIINDMDITNMEEDFIRALSTQTTLEYLCILRNRTDHKAENFNWILNPVACLTNLKQLDICRRYEILSVDTISRLFSHLSRLEELNLVTVDYTDEIWPAMAKLRHLKVLSIGGLGKFTLKGILKFINTLHATNEGLKIRIFDLENVTEEEITEEQNLIMEQELIISQRLLEKVGGSFKIESYSC